MGMRTHGLAELTIPIKRLGILGVNIITGAQRQEYVARHLCDGTHPLSILRLKQLLNSWEMTFDS